MSVKLNDKAENNNRSENKKDKKFFAGVVQKLRYRTVEFNISQYENVVSDINKIDLTQLKDNELQKYSYDLMIQARRGVPLKELLIKAYAVVKEASGRVLGLYPYDVQLAAGVAMHTGALVEMQTGEGKTLTAVFPAYINAIAGHDTFSCHSCLKERIPCLEAC